LRSPSTLERWYQRMLRELDDLPSKLDEMGQRCLRISGRR